MHEIETKLINLLEKSHPVNIFSLGGLQAVLSAWAEIATSRMADEIIGAILKVGESELFPDDKRLSQLVNLVFQRNMDPLVLKNVALLVSEYATQMLDCFSTLMELLDSHRQSFAKGQFLLAAFAIALLEKPKQYRLISFLMEQRVDDNQTFLQYQVKITGLAYSYFANEDLLIMLEELDITLVDHEESYFELGMAYMKKGIDAFDRPCVQENFLKAVEYFAVAESLGREDAACYYRLLSILSDFSNGEEASGLKHRIEDLRAHLMAYSMYNRYRNEIGWATLRHQELMNWFLLCSRLTELSERLGPIGWLNPTLVIEEYLLKIYDAQRSILMRGKDGGLNLLIRPEISKRMSPLSEKVGLLEQWMAAAEGSIAIPLATQLLSEIEDYKRRLILGNESGTASVVLEDIVPSIRNLPVAKLDAFSRYVKNRVLEESHRMDKTLSGIFSSVMDALEREGLNKDAEIWTAFQQIIYYTLFFLKNRLDGTLKNFPRFHYLFNGNNVAESHLQDDYYQNMQPLMTNCNISVEQMDIAGGRADVFFRFLDFFIVAEVKREKRKRTMDEVAHAYIGQTKEYQNTSAKLGVLLFLDLTDKPTGIGSFESHVKTFVHTEAETSIKQGVVIFRVPGNRLRPSKIKLL